MRFSTSKCYQKPLSHYVTFSHWFFLSSLVIVLLLFYFYLYSRKAKSCDKLLLKSECDALKKKKKHFQENWNNRSGPSHTPSAPYGQSLHSTSQQPKLSRKEKKLIVPHSLRKDDGRPYKYCQIYPAWPVQHGPLISLMEICQTENVETLRPHDSLLWRADQTTFYGGINWQQ